MVDVARNRAAQKWSRREQIARLAWAVATPLFLLSPRPFWAWRRLLLRIFGAKIGEGVRIHPTARITMPWHLEIDDQSAIGDYAIIYALGNIKIGKRATISQGAHLCAGTHDWRQPDRPLLKLPITIGEDAWICAEAFVGPGVKIGSGTIVGARAVAMREVPSDVVVIGNPARLRPRHGDCAEM